MASSRGPRTSLLPFQIPIALCDALGRLALPAAVLGLSRGAMEPALIASLVASAASLGRSWLAARAVERALVDAWVEATYAARARPVEALPRRREDEESVASLLQGVSQQATFVALMVPQAAAIALAFIANLVASFLVLGATTTLAGGALLAILGALVLLLGRGMRKSQERTWRAFGTLSREMRVLLEGALELRAAGREAVVAQRVVESARAVARHQAQATAAGLRMGMLPASLALLVVVAPLRAGVQRVQEALAGGRLFETSIIGAAALALAVAAARSWELWTSSAPLLRRYRAFVGATAASAATSKRKLGKPLSEAPIVFREFGYDWNRNGALTPRELDLELEPRSGTALCGPNGCGKTTALLALLGALRPTRGAVTIGGVPADEVNAEDLVGRVGYVPQDPLLLAGESIAWHARLYEDVSDDAIDRSLQAAGLFATLEARARSRAMHVRDLPAGELSGGERRRLALARALQVPRDIYVLDEPEAGLDTEARVTLCTLLEELAQHARVLVVAHDTSAIPLTFRVISLGADGAVQPV